MGMCVVKTPQLDDEFLAPGFSLWTHPIVKSDVSYTKILLFSSRYFMQMQCK